MQLLQVTFVRQHQRGHRLDHLQDRLVGLRPVGVGVVAAGFVALQVPGIFASFLPLSGPHQKGSQRLDAVHEFLIVLIQGQVVHGAGAELRSGELRGSLSRSVPLEGQPGLVLACLWCWAN